MMRGDARSRRGRRAARFHVGEACHVFTAGGAREDVDSQEFVCRNALTLELY